MHVFVGVLIQQLDVRLVWIIFLNLQVRRPRPGCDIGLHCRVETR